MAKRRIEGSARVGVLEKVAEGLLRGRIACAGGCAVVGLAAGFDGVPWRTGPPLVAALVLAAATLLFALLVHHRRERTNETSVVAIVLLAALDAAVVSVVAASGGRGLAIACAPLLLLSLAVHARAAFRSLANVDADVHALRESLGIVRARAESLQLAAAQTGADEDVQHDLDVLVRQTDECQRALKELE